MRLFSGEHSLWRSLYMASQFCTKSRQGAQRAWAKEHPTRVSICQPLSSLKVKRFTRSMQKIFRNRWKAPSIENMRKGVLKKKETYFKCQTIRYVFYYVGSASNTFKLDFRKIFIHCINMKLFPDLKQKSIYDKHNLS